ncbi:MAG: FeoA family protein [Actinomycetota bacterium]
MTPPAATLADVAPGTTATVHALDGVDRAWRERLQAYGLVPGRRVHVLQHAPVTVVEVEHAQVAFERCLACGIRVTAGCDGVPGEGCS